MTNTDQTTEVVLSPCINVCEVDETNICNGCYRSLDEIAAWGSLSNVEQKKIVDQANKRREVADNL